MRMKFFLVISFSWFLCCLGYCFDVNKSEIEKELLQARSSLKEGNSALVQEYLKEAKVYYQVGDFRGSISAVRKGLYLDPNNKDLLFLWGKSLIGLGNYEDAKNVFASLVRIDPEFLEGWRWYYRCCRNLLDLEGEEECLENLFRLEKEEKEKEKYFDRLIDILKITKKEGKLRFFLKERIKFYIGKMCRVDIKKKSEESIKEIILILRKIERLREKDSAVSQYYEDFIEQLYDILHLFSMGYRSIALDQLQDLFTQKCQILSS